MKKILFLVSVMILLIVIGAGCTTQNEPKTQTKTSTFISKFKPDDIISFTPTMENSIRSYLAQKGISIESKKVGALITQVNKTRVSQNTITKENSTITSYDYIVIYQVDGNNWRLESGITGWEAKDFVDGDPTRILLGNLRSINLQNG